MSFVYIGIGCAVSVLYFLLMGWTYYHLGRKVTSKKAFEHIDLTILIPCRNEAHHLPRLAHSLKNFNGQLLIIDDHSEDQTVAEAAKLFPQGHVLKNLGAGKKAALKTGLAEAKGSKVLCLDADILIDDTWIDRCQQYLQENVADLHLFPVLVHQPDSFLACFEAFDMLGLMSITKASANAGKPVLANGAALCVSRTDFIDCQNELREDQASGDDVFLLQAMKKREKHILFVDDLDLKISIEPHITLNAFLEQRIRWGQKSSSYSDIFAKRTAWIVLLANLWFVMSLQLAGVMGARGAFQSQKILMLFVVPKMLVDLIVSIKANRLFGTELTFSALLRGIFFYPFYILFVGLSGFFYRPYWKGRKV